MTQEERKEMEKVHCETDRSRFCSLEADSRPLVEMPTYRAIANKLLPCPG